MKVEIYSDIVCPWCYIGERRFQRALEAFGPAARDVEVVFRPYQLDPSAPMEPGPLRERLAMRFGQSAVGMMDRVTESAAGEGIDIDWESAIFANTITAHRLMWLADREYGPAVQTELAEKLFELHFTRGGDVSSARDLTEAAVAAGMDEARVTAFLASSEGLEEVRDQIESARRIGVVAVPTFVFDGKWAIQGAQPVSTFLRALEDVKAAEAEKSAPAPDADCADGVCAV